MTDNLTLIIEWARQIQLAAQLEITNTNVECNCKLIDVEDIIIKLLQITDVVMEEFKEKEKVIFNLRTECTKKEDEISLLSKKIIKLQIHNKQLQLLSNPAENNKKLDLKSVENTLFTQQFMDSQYSSSRKKNSPIISKAQEPAIKQWGKYLWLNENIKNNQLVELQNSQIFQGGFTSGKKDRISDQVTLFHSKSTELFQLSHRDVVRNLMEVSKNELNINCMRQMKVKRNEQNENKLFK